MPEFRSILPDFWDLPVSVPCAPIIFHWTAPFLEFLKKEPKISQKRGLFWKILEMGQFNEKWWGHMEQTQEGPRILEKMTKIVGNSKFQKNSQFQKSAKKCQKIEISKKKRARVRVGPFLKITPICKKPWVFKKSRKKGHKVKKKGNFKATWVQKKPFLRKN